MPSAEAAPSDCLAAPPWAGPHVFLWGLRRGAMRELHDAKAAARAEARARRAALAAAGASAAAELVQVFRCHLVLPRGAVVAGYCPIATELDPRPLLHHLVASGHRCALPVVVGRGRPLVFRAWTPQSVLEAGAFGVPVPPATAAELRPDVVLVPLLAFDRQGYRLGYGAGFYDRTLERLRAAGPVLAVGLGYAGQEVAAVPHDARDQPLNWIVTERAALKLR